MFLTQDTTLHLQVLKLLILLLILIAIYITQLPTLQCNLPQHLLKITMSLLIQFLQLKCQLALETLLIIHALFEVLHRCLDTSIGTQMFSTCYFTVVVRPSFSVLKVLVRLMLKSKLLIFCIISEYHKSRGSVGFTQLAVLTLTLLEGLFGMLALLARADDPKAKVLAETVVGFQESGVWLKSWRMFFKCVDEKLTVEEDFRKPSTVDESIYTCDIFFSDLLMLGKIHISVQLHDSALNGVIESLHLLLVLHPSKKQLTEDVVFLIYEVVRVDEVQGPCSEDQPAHLSWRIREPNYLFRQIMLIEGDFCPTFIVACCCVYPERYIGFETTVKREASAFDQGRTDGRMMADLLAVKESAVDCFLVGLANDRVEGFVTADVASWTGE